MIPMSDRAHELLADLEIFSSEPNQFSLYDQLVRIQPSPVVQLNRAVAIPMCDGPEAGLTHIDALLEHGELANYHLAHSARADMYRRLGRTAEARASCERRWR
jgi:RNA polymerase sigma-70 factor, ECF subfamily